MTKVFVEGLSARLIETKRMWMNVITVAKTRAVGLSFKIGEMGADCSANTLPISLKSLGEFGDVAFMADHNITHQGVSFETGIGATGTRADAGACVNVVWDAFLGAVGVLVNTYPKPKGVASQTILGSCSLQTNSKLTTNCDQFVASAGEVVIIINSFPVVKGVKMYAKRGHLSFLRDGVVYINGVISKTLKGFGLVFAGARATVAGKNIILHTNNVGAIGAANVPTILANDGFQIGSVKIEASTFINAKVLVKGMCFDMALGELTTRSEAVFSFGRRK
jgi:hypothetical protein